MANGPMVASTLDQLGRLGLDYEQLEGLNSARQMQNIMNLAELAERQRQFDVGQDTRRYEFGNLSAAQRAPWERGMTPSEAARVRAAEQGINQEARAAALAALLGMGGYYGGRRTGTGGAGGYGGMTTADVYAAGDANEFNQNRAAAYNAVLKEKADKLVKDSERFGWKGWVPGWDPTMTPEEAQDQAAKEMLLAFPQAGITYNKAIRQFVPPFVGAMSSAIPGAAGTGTGVGSPYGPFGTPDQIERVLRAILGEQALPLGQTGPAAPTPAPLPSSPVATPGINPNSPRPGLNTSVTPRPPTPKEAAIAALASETPPVSTATQNAATAAAETPAPPAPPAPPSPVPRAQVFGNPMVFFDPYARGPLVTTPMTQIEALQKTMTTPQATPQAPLPNLGLPGSQTDVPPAVQQMVAPQVPAAVVPRAPAAPTNAPNDLDSLWEQIQYMLYAPGVDTNAPVRREITPAPGFNRRSLDAITNAVRRFDYSGGRLRQLP